MLRWSVRRAAAPLGTQFSMPDVGQKPVATTRPASGAGPSAPRRSSIHAQSNYKKGKSRFDLREAVRRDRARIERNKTLPWRERLEDLKVYPWKFFIVFMVLWTWLGTYVVPYMKGDMVSNLPPDVRAMKEGKKPPPPLSTPSRQQS